MALQEQQMSKHHPWRHVFRMILGLLILTSATTASAQNIEWDTDLLERDESWFASDEGRMIADNVLRYQSKLGGWPKNTNLAVWPPLPDEEDFGKVGSTNTFDNDATTVPMAFIARSYQATGDETYLEAFRHGLD